MDVNDVDISAVKVIIIETVSPISTTTGAYVNTAASKLFATLDAILKMPNMLAILTAFRMVPDRWHHH